MSYFLVFYFVAYTALHLVVFLRLRPIWPLEYHLIRGLGLWSLAMIFLPLVARLLEGQGIIVAARLLAWVGYLWMAFILLAFAASLFTWVLQALLNFCESLSHRRWLFNPAPLMAVLALILAFLATVYGFSQSTDLRVERLTLPTAKLAPGAGRTRILVTSDLHLGLTSQLATLGRLAAVAVRERPDLWVDLGDMVDGDAALGGQAGELMAKIRPPLGKFTILGNHERYAGRETTEAFHQESGFVLLDQRAQTLPNGVTLVGLSDPGRGTPDEDDEDDELEELAEDAPPPPQPLPALVAGLPAGGVNLLLKHRPEPEPAALGVFDLMLSGHTHNGQLFPYRYLIALAYPLIEGRYPLPGGGMLYT